MDSGFFCLQVMGAFHQVAVDKINLQHKFFGHLEISPDGNPVFGRQAILLAAHDLGLKTKVVRQDPKRLDKAALPAVAQHRDGRYFILGKYDPGNKNGDHIAQPRLLIQYENAPLNLFRLKNCRCSGPVKLFTSQAKSVSVEP